MPLAIGDQLYDDEVHYTASLLGIPVDSPEKPADALKSDGGTKVPDYNTPLSEAEQADYNTKFGPNDSADYDMQGFYKANPTASRNAEGVHYTDEFKKPNHMTFSTESKYSTPETQGGVWSQENGQDVFTPSAFNLQQHSPQEMKDYFAKVEPNSKLNILPDINDVPHHDWIESTIKAIPQALALPGDILSGKVKAGTSQELERAAELAGLMVMGPAPVASKLADGTLGSFIGVKAKTFDRNALGGAQVLESNGVHPDDIFKQTGMFRGTDGRWRSEVPDLNSKLNPAWLDVVKQNPEAGAAFSGKLVDVLDHPELYKAYPDLKNMEVRYDPNHPSASYNPADDSISVGPNFVGHKETYLHEVQHAIQEREGFAKGGSPVNDPKLRWDDDISKLIRESGSILSKESRTPEETARLKYIEKVINLQLLRKEAGKQRALENYMRLAGEVEARNVELRAVLGDNHRNYAPWYSQDRPLSEQTVVDQPVFATPYGYSHRPDEVPN